MSGPTVAAGDLLAATDCYGGGGRLAEDADGLSSLGLCLWCGEALDAIGCPLAELPGHPDEHGYVCR